MPMNINLNPTPTASTITPSPTTTTPTLDSDTDTPPPPSPPQPKRVPLSRHHAPPCTAVVVVSYKECLKNHAASIGGHALDGCCEFLPGPTFDPLDPTSLKCAACGCHRNFHRRDPDDPTPLHHRNPVARVPHSPPRAWQNGNHTSRKRSRTKFSPRQKEKMLEFSEKIGWKLKKGENKLVEEFCKEIGVERGVFKVWMHNNKHSYSSLRREKERNLLHNLSNGSCGGGVNQFCGNGSQKQEII